MGALDEALRDALDVEAREELEAIEEEVRGWVIGGR